MRIGISGYVGNKLTGIGRVLLNIVRALAVAHPEDEYIIFKNFDFKDFDPLLEYPNVKLVDVPVTKESGLKNILFHQWTFQKLLRKYNCDLAYIPNFSLLLWKQRPTVVTIHDLIEYNVKNKFGKLRMAYRKVADPLLAMRSDYILTVSKSSKRDIVKFLGQKEDKILVTPNAADREVFRPYAEAEIERAIAPYGLKRGEYLLFVGTIDYPGKNIMTVVDAYLNLREKGELQGEKLVIIGKKGFNADVILDRVNSSKFRDDVVFTGYISDEDLPKFYAGARIMLYLSFYEGFGLPVLEAMSCGTPVICPDTSCFPEIVRGIDVAVSPSDVEAVETKILEISNDPAKAAEISKACLERAKDYSWEASAELYHKAFSDLLAKKSR